MKLGILVLMIGLSRSGNINGHKSSYRSIEGFRNEG